MSENDQDRQLDALLDSLLSAYTAVEPGPGFEMRIRAGLRTQATRTAQRRRTWTLVFAISAAAIFLTAWLIRARTDTVSPPNQVVRHKETEETKTKQALVIPPVTFPPRPVTARSVQAARNKTRALIRLADAMHGDDLAFEREQSYVAPSPQESKAPGEQQVPGDKIDIPTLGVESIEIKEIAPDRSDEKGNLR